MYEFRNQDGAVVKRYQRFMHVRSLIYERRAVLITLSRFRRDEAVITIHLNDGHIFTQVLSLRRAKKMIGGWRTLYGTPIIVDRQPCGNLHKWHPDLRREGAARSIV
jgi:hypothetical protein